jgi:3'-5' exoribonuclease
MSYISGLDGDLKKLVETTINMTNNRFWYWTAARGHHHSRLGGLVVHTVEVIENALSIYENCNMPKYCDRNVLIASSILHDVGKCFEYKVDEIGNTEYSTQGVLEGHISIGLRMVDRAYNELKSNGEEIPISKMESIRHCILAHHGKLEYGSPVTPATVEATILNFSDNISASLNKMRTTMKDMEPEQFVSNWTSEGYKNCYLSEDVIDRKEETI